MGPFEKATVAASCTLMLGSWAGWKCRRLVERVRLRKEAKRLHELQVERDNQKLVCDVKEHYEKRERLARRVLKPEVLPALQAPARATTAWYVEQPIPVVETGRDDVVMALTGVGYKKRLAERAADSCDDGERASVEAWMAAALRRVSTLP